MANFTPTFDNYNNVKPFRFWVQTVIPLVYDNSLSYMELLAKVVDYLNNLIEDNRAMINNIDALLEAYNQLQNYVNEYFDNLDVQEEIDNKLDRMVLDGTMSTLIEPFIGDFQEQLDLLEARVDNIAQLPEGGTTGDAELRDIRVSYTGKTYVDAGTSVRKTDEWLDRELTAIQTLFGSDVEVNFTQERETIVTDFYLKAGVKYYFLCDSVYDSYITAYVTGYLDEYATIRSGVVAEYTPTHSGYMSVFNNSVLSGFTSLNVTTNIHKKIEDILTNIRNDEIKTVMGYAQYNNNTQWITAFPSNKLADIPANKIICLGAITINAIDKPTPRFLGNVVTLSGRTDGLVSAGAIQLAFSTINNDIYMRSLLYKSGQNVWEEWRIVGKDTVFYVGGDSEYQSITELFLLLKNDTRDKTIYINSGTYDIYQEYRDAEIPTPPDNVSTSDYLDRCVFVPPNTKLIGLGNVKLLWKPNVADITVGEARTWSPLNVRYACHIENIEIEAKYARYCIHDDSHNSSDDIGVRHTYKNVKAVYEYNADGYGLNNTTGFGFSDKNIYEFDNCHFEIDSVNSAFYGHGNSTGNLADCGTVNVKNSIVKNTGGNCVRLQGLNTTLMRIKAMFSSCYFSNGFRLQNSAGASGQPIFDVTLLKCGTPTQVVDYAENPYPIKVFN